MVSTLVVSGALATKPGNGGEAWVVMSWVRGLARLGFDVWFVEEIGLADADAVSWFSAVIDRFGLTDRAVLTSVHDGDPAVHTIAGPLAPSDVVDLIAGSALVVNISGSLGRPELLGIAPRVVYVDLDPGYTQVWAATGLGGLGLDQHDLLFTVGEGIAAGRTPFPMSTRTWLPCRQPVLLDDWPVEGIPDGAALTTVATWRSTFGPLTWDGTTYGLKLHEFRKLADLPTRCPVPLEVAVAMYDADVGDGQLLRDGGWRVTDSTTVAATPDAFGRYVRASLGEFAPAQGAYVAGRTGWFSDRTVRYLASGRPAIVQDTGVEDLPIGDGLLTFVDATSAAQGVHRVVNDLDHHARAARELAEQHFDAERVLVPFVDRCEVSP